MRKEIKILYLLPLLLIFLSLSVNAQYGSFGITNAQNTGIGNSFGSAFGISSIGNNPAMLSYPLDSSSYVSFQIPNIAAKALETSMSLDNFNNFFNYPKSKDLTDEQRNDFFKAFGTDNGLYFDIAFTEFAISWKPSANIGTFAYSMNDIISGTFKVPLTLIDLMINGNKPMSNYNFNEMQFNTWWIRSHNLSYSREIMKFNEDGFIKNLTGGITLKLITGFAYAGIESIDANLNTGVNNVLTGKVNYLARVAASPDFGLKYDFDTTDMTKNQGINMKPAGSGFGFDLGVAADLAYNLRVGLALTDVGSIKWSERAAEYKASGDIKVDDLFNHDQQHDLENFLKDSSYNIGSFSTSLPTALKLSVAYELSQMVKSIPGRMVVDFGYYQGFNKMPSNSTTPRVALGVFWKTKPWIPVISTGFTNNIAGDIVWSAGLGFSTSVLDFSLATQDLISLMSNSSTPYVSLALNFIWKINY